MYNWIFRPGYPLLSARREGSTLVLRQQRFRYLPAEGDDSTWQVPVQVRIETAAGSTVERLLLSGREQRLPLPADARLILVNEGGHGFYRVGYDDELIKRVLDRLPSLAAIERFNLVNDAWAAVLAGLGSLTAYLNLTARFEGERDRNVWSVLLGSFAFLNRLIDEEDRPTFQVFVRRRLASALNDLGWQPRQGEDELTTQLRGDLLRVAGTLGNDPAVQARAAQVFGREDDAAVQAAAVAILAHCGDAARYEDFLARFRAAGTPQEEQRYLMALAGFQPLALVERSLKLALDGVRTQDAPMLLRALLMAPHSRARGWAFFQANWDRMAATFPTPGLRRLCEGVLGLTTPEWEREVIAFFREQNVSLGGKTLEQLLEQLHVAVRLWEREGAALKAYLRQSV
jgi:puromycin-sensitive aminopeptidase